jgi:RNA polymerase sigma-70 factor (ECF subfamily)
MQASAVLETAAKLKEPYRTVFHLRFIDNRSFKEIGAYFGKSENWACVTCHRARQTVRREINEHE